MFQFILFNFFFRHCKIAFFYCTDGDHERRPVSASDHGDHHGGEVGGRFYDASVLSCSSRTEVHSISRFRTRHSQQETANVLF